MSKLKTKPLLFALVVIVLIIFFHKIPLFNFLSSIGLNKYEAASYDTILTNLISIIGLYLLKKKEQIPFKLYTFNIKKLKYYCPLLLYVIIFSGGFKDFQNFNFSSVNVNTLFSYTLKYCSSSFLEEFLFRGFILGILLLNFPKTKNGVFKSIALSGLTFGIMHSINLWTIEGQTLKGTLNQVYASTCFGIMYAATYVKTRSILILGIFHFISNFFSAINELKFIAPINEVTVALKPLINIVISEMFRLVIFGIPLAIGLLLIYSTAESDLNKLVAAKKKEVFFSHSLL